MSSSSRPDAQADRGLAPARRYWTTASNPGAWSGCPRKGAELSASISRMIATPTATERQAALAESRARTFQLFDLAPSEEVLHGAPLPGFRPVLWHLAHIGAFEGYW